MLVVETLPTYSDHFRQPFAKDEEGQHELYKVAIYSIDVAINLFFTIDLVIK